MSICRFSSDNWKSDVYIYESECGIELHIASSRIISDIPKLPPLSEYKKAIIPKNREQLKQLKKLWGDTTQSRVITRCIEWAWFVEIGNTKIDKKPSQLIEEEEGKKKS